MEIHHYSLKGTPKDISDSDLVQFLFEHLEDYRDDKRSINSAIEYALNDKSHGGHVLLAMDGAELQGVCVINRTGMKGYIPENILVYIATHRSSRGKGIGKNLMKEAIQCTDGDIALHVEKDNPAIGLYRSFGFTNPYLEMRLKKEH